MLYTQKSNAAFLGRDSTGIYSCLMMKKMSPLSSLFLFFLVNSGRTGEPLRAGRLCSSCEAEA